MFFIAYDLLCAYKFKQVSLLSFLQIFYELGCCIKQDFNKNYGYLNTYCHLLSSLNTKYNCIDNKTIKLQVKFLQIIRQLKERRYPVLNACLAFRSNNFQNFYQNI